MIDQQRDEQDEGVLVLGIGNVLLQDEGVGVRALMELERRYCCPDGVELLDGGTSGIELLRHIRNRDHLIILDAMQHGKSPGTITRLQGAEVPAAFRTRISPHQLGLSDLLAAALLTDEMPQQVVLFGVEPTTVDIGLEMTKAVQDGMEALITAIVSELDAMGYPLTPRPLPLPVSKNCFLPI